MPPCGSFAKMMMTMYEKKHTCIVCLSELNTAERKVKELKAKMNPGRRDRDANWPQDFDDDDADLKTQLAAAEARVDELKRKLFTQTIFSGGRIVEHAKNVHAIADENVAKNNVHINKLLEQKRGTMTIAERLSMSGANSAFRSFMFFWAEECMSFRCVEHDAMKAFLALVRLPDQGKQLPKTAIAMRRASLDTAQELVAEQLVGCEGRIGTLSVDGGTVHTRYLAVVLHIRGKPPVVVALTPDFVADEHWADNVDQQPHLTIEVIVDTLRKIIEGLFADFSIRVAGIVSDNAQNLVSSIKKIGVFSIRCGCHGFQLLVHTMMGQDQSLRAADNLAVQFKDRETTVSIPDPGATRWDGILTRMICVVKHSRTSPTVTRALNRTETALLESAIDKLTPFRRATKLVQGTHSNLLDLLEAIAVIKDSVVATDVVRDKFIERVLFAPLLLLALTFRAHTKPVPLVTDVAMMTIRTAVSSLICGSVKRVEEVAEQLMGWMTAPLSKTDKVSELVAARDGGGSRAQLTWYMAQLEGMPPSEAECERVFSKVKKLVPVERKGLEAEAVQAQLIISMSAKVSTADDATAIDVVSDGDDDDGETRDSRILAGAKFIVELTEEHLEKKDVGGSEALDAGPSTPCQACGILFRAHPGRPKGAINPWIDSHAARCTCCNGWFVLACLQIFQTPAADWKCEACRKAPMPKIW